MVCHVYRTDVRCDMIINDNILTYAHFIPQSIFLNNVSVIWFKSANVYLYFCYFKKQKIIICSHSMLPDFKAFTQKNPHHSNLTIYLNHN